MVRSPLPAIALRVVTSFRFEQEALIGSGLPVLHIRFEVHFKCSCTCLTDKFLTFVYIKPLDLSQITYGWRSEVCHFMYIYVYIC